MNVPVYASAVPMPPVLSRVGGPESSDVNRRILLTLREQLALLKGDGFAVQKEQLGVLKSMAAAQDGLARWRAFLARWQSDFPNVGPSCKQVLPVVERAYLTLLQDMTEKLKDDPEFLEDEFLLAEFLDKYGMRLNQLGAVLGQLGPLADACPAPASPPAE